MYDILIMGAGITGSILARELSKYNLNVGVIEKGNDVASGASMANSAIVHTGYDPEDGTLKATLNVKGAKLYPQLLEELHCHHKQVGAWLVARSQEEIDKLTVLEERAKNRNIPYAYIDLKEAFEEEPHLNKEICKVLSFPTTQVIYPWEVVTHAMENAIENGVDLFLNQEVLKIVHDKETYTVITNDHTFQSKMVINCTGTHCESLARQVSNLVKYHSCPKKGEYFVLDQGTDLVKHIIFPIPTSKGKGVLAVPTVYGNVLLGPSSDRVEDNDDVGNTSVGLQYVRKEISNILTDIPFHKIIRSFTGLRPSTDSKDFMIAEYEDARGFVDVASIESPGLASSPAIAEYVIDNFISHHFELTNKEIWKTYTPQVCMQDLSIEERNAYIHKRPLYGKIVCRCEGISEQEIIDAIHATIPCTSIKAIKKRVRPGMGKCQGGFCEPIITKILARELDISETDVVYDTKKSNILSKENR